MALPGTEQDTSKFSLSCEQWADYPANLIYPSELEHELVSYRATLNDSSVKLFHPNPRMRLLHIWSLETENQDHILTPNLKTKAELQQILASGTSCPVERYIFAQSVSSRDALACEKEQMLLVLSHIQVMPSFLDIMFTFKAREAPHMRTRFSYETCLEKSQPRLSLPSLGISGFRIQHCFNLIGVEKDKNHYDPWLIRQTAAYHSFDVACRRSTWIVLKGNKLIRERLQKSTAGYRKKHPQYPQTVQGCFLANLRSHILIFQWSAENWESYIDYLEAMLRRARNVATNGPVLELATSEGIEMNLKKNETWATLPSRQGSGLSENILTPTSPTRSGRLLGIFRSAPGLDSQLNQPARPVSGYPTNTDRQTQDLDLGEMFSFDQLQSIHRLGGRLQEGINILAENKRLLEEVKQYFQSLIDSKDFSSFVDLHDYVEDVVGFFQRIDKIIWKMDSHQARLRDILEKAIQDAKSQLPGGPPRIEESQHPGSIDISMLHDTLSEPEYSQSFSRTDRIFTPPGSAEPITQASENTLRSVSETSFLLSMQDAAGYREAKKTAGRINPKVEWVIEKLMRRLGRRNHLFFIDDTESMKKHSSQIEESFQTLAYIAKRIDPDQLELSFVSKPHAIIKNRHTGPLTNELRQHLSKHVSVTGRIESSLSTLVHEKILRRLPVSIPLFGQVRAWYKPITIFVFTDGKWGEGVVLGSGLTHPISKVMREMKKRGLDRTHVMFQFLRFGDDDQGRQHLSYLDEFGKAEKWDIVDTRDINGDVYSMFLAALTDDDVTVLRATTSEIGGLRLAIPKDRYSKEKVLVEDNHSHESQDKEISAELLSVQKGSNAHSLATLESFRSPSALQHDNSGSFPQSISGTQSKQSTVPSTGLAPYLESFSGTRSKKSTSPSTCSRGSSLDRDDHCGDTPDINDICQSSSLPNEVSDDIESIASIPDSISSTASASHSLGQIGVNYIVAKFTQCDPELHTLYTEASQKLTQSRFVDNNGRLLKLFQLEIAREVQTAPQAEAASFLKSRTRINAISSGIFETMIPDDGISASLVQHEEELSRLNRYFDTLEPIMCEPVAEESSTRDDRQVPDQNTDDEQEGSSDDDSETGLDLQEPSPGAILLQATGDFFVTSQAFASYKQRLHDFIRPSHGKKQETAGRLVDSATTPDPQLSFSHTKTDGIAKSELAFSGEQASKEKVPLNDSYETQDKAIPAERPPVEEEPDSITCPTSEGFQESSPYTSQDVNFGLSPPTIPMWTRVRKLLIDRLWPPQDGSQRIWYLCGCGRHTYIDVEELEPGGALESVRQSIINSAAAVRARPTLPQYGGSNPWQSNLATPSPVYSASSSSRGAQTTPFRTTAPSLPSLPTGVAIPTIGPTSTEPQKMHLLVCISGREYETLPKVRHLEIAENWNDGMLLGGLLREYEQARQGRHWSVSLLLPSLPSCFAQSSFVKSLRESQILSFIRNSSVWEWWFRWAPDGGLWAPLYLPSTADFVKFQVVSQTATQEPVPDQFECGQWPSSANPWPYCYKPVPMRRTTVNIPLWHELRYPGPHLGYQWFNAAAKKLDGRLFTTPLPNDCIPDIVGFGIRVNERLNDVLILWWSWISIISTGIFVLVYIRWTGDHSSAFSLGAYLVAAFTVYIQLQYAWWRRT